MTHNRSLPCSFIFLVVFLLFALNAGFGQVPTFAPAVTYSSTGRLTFSMAVGDVNGDGKPDLVMANECVSSSNCTSGSVSVLLGNGDGTFKAPLSYGSGGYSPESVAVGDVNGDGKLDLLVVNTCDGTSNTSNCATNGSVGVLLGNGDGTFLPAVTYGSGGYHAFSVSVRDVNGDNKLDLVVANICMSSSNCNSNGNIGVLLGNGDGTFHTAVTYGSGGSTPYSLVVADVNGDNKPDVLVANGCADSSCAGFGTIGVLLGNGDGTFQTAVTYGSGGNDRYDAGVAVADVNGDGKPDVLIANGCADSSCADGGSVGVLLGNGDGTFQEVVNYDSGGYSAAAVAVADINADGKPDLVVGNGCVAFSQNCTTLSGGLGVLLGNGDGTFQAAVSYGTGGDYAYSVAVADVNGDGKLDLLASNWCPSSGCGGSGSVGVLLQGSTGKPTTTTFKASPQEVIAGEPVHLNLEAWVKGSPNSTPMPTGSVEFEFPHTGTCIGGFTCIGEAQLVNGRAILDLEYIFVSNAQCLVAVYSGDANYAPSTSPEFCPGYSAATTKTKIVSSPNPVIIGGTATITATVIPEFTLTPTGTIKFTQNGFTLGTATLSAGQASITNTFPVAGTHVILATYSGDTNFKASTGTLKQVVSLNPSTTVVTASPNPSTHGQAVQLSATVSSAASGGATGTVTFKNGTTILGTATLSAGTATLNTTKLPVGTLTITANYNGDKQSAKSSGTTSQTVN